VTYSVAVIGGGIVGMATAMTLGERLGSSLVVLEAETHLGGHQSGHNSGVIHSGLYYKPGSLKAQNCTEGRELMYRFCETHGIPHRRCGKVVVATEHRELEPLGVLEERGRANGLTGIRRLRRDDIRALEPAVSGLAGLHVPETGVVDYRNVLKAYAGLATDAGVEIRMGARVRAVDRAPDGFRVTTDTGTLGCTAIVNCAGLQADRVTRLCGVAPGLEIVPFRGEFWSLKPARRSLIRTLVYPVPDPAFPFLGVHLSRRVDDSVECGPNAVLAWKREGYRHTNVSARDLAQMARYGGFWRMASRHWRTGVHEMWRSFSKRSFLASLQRLVPELQLDDLVPGGSGVRAQAVEPDGTLVDDFRIVESEGMVHVLNAPSPAATASIAIGRSIAAIAADRFGLRRAG
jgi:(S)-2-hydroxyglutarate dehydrogenase